MTQYRVTAEHLDYLQNVQSSGTEFSDPAADSPATQAIEESRRLWRVEAIGRHARNGSTNQKELILPSEDAVISMYGYRVPIAFDVSGDGPRTNIAFGTWDAGRHGSSSAARYQQNHEVLGSALRSLYPEMVLRETQPDSKLTLPLSAMAFGTPSRPAPDSEDSATPWDRLFRSLAGHQFSVLVLADPVKESSIAILRAKVIEEMRRVDTLKQANQAALPLIEHYVELLKAALQHLTDGITVGAWRVGTYLRGDADSFYLLRSLWRGVFSGTESLPQPVRVEDSPASDALARSWSLPLDHGLEGPGPYHHPFAYQTVLSSHQLATITHFPEREIPGFQIKRAPKFDSVPPRIQKESLKLGRIIVRGKPVDMEYEVEIDDLTRHVMIAGVTGAGKTNTVFSLLRNLYKHDIPFLVIEPVKTEYRSLFGAPDVADAMQLFTIGDESVAPFRINPFEVPDGIPVSMHIDLLRSVFAASFGLWTPLPQVLERCIIEVYEDRGWDVTTNTNARVLTESDRAVSFPSLTDLAAKIDSVSQDLGYEERVTADIRAALLTRLDSLRRGAKGRMFDTTVTVDFGDILKRPTVIELDALGDDDDKAFVMALMLIRLAELRRVQGPHKGLKHLLVFEEAHRLLSQTSSSGRPEDADPRGRAVESFAQILSEIRAFGQGVMVADQVPTKLSSDILKNTNLKIAHRVVSADDRAVLAGSMAMQDGESQSFTTLGVGQAAIFGQGDDAPVLVQVDEQESLVKIPSIDQIVSQMRPVISETLTDEHGSCADACRRSPATCDAARSTLEDPPWREDFFSVCQAATEDVGLLRRLLSSFEVSMQHAIPAGIDPDMFIECLIAHGCDLFAHRRGVQYKASYADTLKLRDSLREMMNAHINSDSAEDGTVDVENAVNKVFARAYDPYPACSRICTATPNTCLYRYALSDVIRGKKFDAAWSASRHDDGDSRENLQHLNAVAFDASATILERPTADMGFDTGSCAAEATRRAALCFAQQMHARESRLSVSERERQVDSLIREFEL